MRKFIHLMSNCFTAGLFTSMLVPIAFLSLLLPLSLIALVFMFLVETFGSRELHNLFDEIFFYALFFNANPSYFFYFIYGCFVSGFCIRLFDMDQASSFAKKNYLDTSLKNTESDC